MMKIQVNEGKGEIAKLHAQVEELKLENSGIATDESKMKDHYLQLKEQLQALQNDNKKQNAQLEYLKEIEKSYESQKSDIDTLKQEKTQFD